MKQPIEVPHPLVQSMMQAQARHQFFPLDHEGLTPLVVGVSGGADSICLLHLLYHFKAQWRLDLHVAHFDHAVRADSALDAEFVANLAEQLKLPLHTERLAHAQSLDQRSPNEATLRTLRYKFLCTVARSITPSFQIPIVTVAHHADDQAETLILRLLRGSGLQGLGGMRPVTRMFSTDLDEYVQIIRPLLDVRRSEIIRYLHDHNVVWREDSSNLSLVYARNRIRHKVLPELLQINPQAVDSIARTAKLLDDGAVRLARLDRALLELLRIGDAQKDRVLLDLQKFQRLEESEQRAVLYLALQDLLREPETWGELGFEQIEILRQQLHTQQSASLAHRIVGDLAWSVVAEKSDAPLQLSLHRVSSAPRSLDHPHLPNSFAPQTLTPNTTLHISEWSLHITLLDRDALPPDWRKNSNPWQAWLDADQVAVPILCSWATGMQIAPLGMNGKSKSLGDFFTDRKIHPSERERWCLVVDQTTGELLWVCGLAVAHSARITEVTTQVVGLKWERNIILSVFYVSDAPGGYR